MRSFLFGVFLFGSATLAHAAITPDALRDLAYQNDVEGVQAAVAQAHKESLSGQISYEDLRNMTTVLFRTHPDMESFRDLWLESMPESAYAQSAKAWSLFSKSFDIRGTDTAGRTPESALRAFGSLQREAMTFAMAAYATAPDYVPASDAVIVMQGTTKSLWPWQIKLVINDTMAATPNFGSLTRASNLSDRRWGGQGPQYNRDLCSRYYDKIPEYPNLTQDACVVSLFSENDQFAGNWNYIADVLDREDHPVLETARVFRALERGTEEDRQTVMDYLRAVEFDDPWFSQDRWVLQSFSDVRRFMPTTESLAFSEEVRNRLYDEVRAQLEDDPFRLALLTTTISDPRMIATMPAIGSNEFQNYKMRIAVIQPFHVNNWIDAYPKGASKHHPSMLTTLDAPYLNAIVYSDHNIFMITNYLQSKITQYNLFLQGPAAAGDSDMPWPSETEFLDVAGCRLSQLIRLFDDAAERFAERRNFVDGFRIDMKLEEITSKLRRSGVCAQVWAAQIDDLKFQPVAIDRTLLMTIPKEEEMIPLSR